MNVHEIIYDQLKSIQDDLKILRATAEKNSGVLAEHQRRSIRNEERLELLEQVTIKVNWKTIGVFFGILASTSTVVFYTARLFLK